MLNVADVANFGQSGCDQGRMRDYGSVGDRGFDDSRRVSNRSVSDGSYYRSESLDHGRADRVHVSADPLHHCVKARVRIRGILDESHAAVGLYEGVGPLDVVSVARLPLGLVVSCVRVVYGVVEPVI